MRWTLRGINVVLATVTIVLLLMPGWVKQPAHAAIFVVNSTSDLPDNNTGDGVCQTPLGTCTLRAAIQQANALPGADVIHFSIGTGLQTITPTATLPTITDPILIDGTTQPGYINTPIIVLSGTGAGNVDGLTLSARNSTIRGLVINQFDIGISIQDDDTDNNFIVGNFIGTTASGLAPAPNRTAGIRLSDGAANNTIGGIAPADRNVISGNSGIGILVMGADTEPNTIIGNYIGTDLTGTLIDPSPIIGDELGNGSFGISVTGGADRLTISDNVISGNDDGIRFSGGGTTNHQVISNFIGTDATGTTILPNRGNGINILSGAQRIQIGSSNLGNVISGNALNGIHIQSSASAVTIQSNFIGTNLTQSTPLGNGFNGIYLSYSNANRPGENFIGGFGVNAGNIIAFNGQAGVRIDYPNQPTGSSPYIGAGNTISSNSIFANGGLGIDLVWLNTPTGPTLNDPAPDADNGPNDLQNFPDLLRANTNGINATAIQGSLTTRPSLQVRVEFFNSPTCDPSGFGEGATFLGFYNGTTDSTGVLNFSITLPIGVPVGSVITATTVAQTVPTSNYRNTSEFSPCLSVLSTTNLVLTKTDNVDPVLVGNNLIYTLTVTNTGSEAATNVILTDPLGAIFVSSLPSAPICTEVGGIVTCNLGNLAAGASVAVQIEINVPAPNNLLNTASVTGNELESNYLDNTASQSTNVITETATPTNTPTAVTATLLSATATATSTPMLVSTTPTSTALLPNPTATPPLPSFIMTSTNTWIPSNTTTATPVPSRTSTRTPRPTRTIMPSRTATLVPTHTNVPTSTPRPSQTPVPSATAMALPTNTATPVPLEVAKEPVDDDTYTITISNPGVAYITQLLLTEQLRPGMSFVASNPSAPTCQQVDGRITCQLGTLAGGASTGVRIEVDPAGLDLLSGQTTVQANGQTVASVDRPYIAKFASPDFVEPGAEIVWTIQVINPTNRVASNVQVVDVIPADFEILAASSTQGTISQRGQQITLRLAVLAPIDALTITIQTRLNTEVENPIIPNRACLTTREFPTQRCAETSLLRVHTLPATGESYWGQWRLPILWATAIGMLSATLLLWRLKTRRNRQARLSRTMQQQ